MRAAYHSKIAVGSNHALIFPIGADGTAFRSRGIGLFRTFMGPGATAVADPDLVPRLKRPAARLGIAAWIAQGAQRFYALGAGALTCPRFEAASFELQVQSSPYMAWLVDEYHPTGKSEDRITFDSLLSDFIASKRSPAAVKSAHEGLKAALASAADYVFFDTWGAYAGVEHSTVRGYTGLRLRRPGDPAWVVARDTARERRAQAPAAA